MARRANAFSFQFQPTYQAQTPIGAALGNIMGAFMGGPSPYELAEYEADLGYKRAQTAAADAEAKLRQQEFAAPQSAADAFAKGLAAGNWTDVLPGLVQSLGVTGDYGDLGSLLRAGSAQMPGATLESMTMPMLGAGDAFLSTPGGTREKFGADYGQAMDVQGSQNAAAAARQAMANATTLRAQEMQNAAALERAQWVLQNTPVEVGAGETAFLAPGMAVGGGETTLYGMPTQATALGEALTRALAGQPVPVGPSIAAGMVPSEEEVRAQAFLGLDPALQSAAVGPTETEAKGTAAMRALGGETLSPADRVIAGLEQPAPSALSPAAMPSFEEVKGQLLQKAMRGEQLTQQEWAILGGLLSKDEVEALTLQSMDPDVQAMRLGPSATQVQGDAQIDALNGLEMSEAGKVIAGLMQPAPNPAAPKDPALEVKIQTIMRANPGMSYQQAANIATGVAGASQDPTMGGINFFDQSTKSNTFVPTVIPETPAPTGTGPLTTSMPQVDYSQGTGASGAAGSIANTFTDPLGAGLVAPETERAVQGLKNLFVRTQTMLQDAVPGRPSNYLMEQLSQLAVDPGSIWMGDARAAERLQQTRDMLATEIERMQRDILGQPGMFSRDDIAKTRMSKSQLEGVLRDYDAVLQSFGAGGASTPKPIPPEFLKDPDEMTPEEMDAAEKYFNSLTP